jgi:hypothetical protein
VGYFHGTSSVAAIKVVGVCDYKTGKLDASSSFSAVRPSQSCYTKVVHSFTHLGEPTSMAYFFTPSFLQLMPAKHTAYIITIKGISCTKR